MGILLALDLGEKRVGVARSDETGTIAEAFASWTIRSREDLLHQLKDCVESLHPEKIVVGYPKTLKGEKGPAAQKVEELVEWLKARLSAEWVLWDERLTTAEAERMLLEADLSRQKRREVRDRVAAQRILQNYLERMQNDAKKSDL